METKKSYNCSTLLVYIRSSIYTPRLLDGLEITVDSRTKGHTKFLCEYGTWYTVLGETWVERSTLRLDGVERRENLRNLVFHR